MSSNGLMRFIDLFFFCFEVLQMLSNEARMKKKSLKLLPEQGSVYEMVRDAKKPVLSKS